MPIPLTACPRCPKLSALSTWCRGWTDRGEGERPTGNKESILLSLLFFSFLLLTLQRSRVEHPPCFFGLPSAVEVTHNFRKSVHPRHPVDSLDNVDSFGRLGYGRIVTDTPAVSAPDSGKSRKFAGKGPAHPFALLTPNATLPLWSLIPGASLVLGTWCLVLSAPTPPSPSRCEWRDSQYPSQTGPRTLACLPTYWHRTHRGDG